MKIRTLVFLLITHLMVGGGGFALGIYMLPILIAPDAPSESKIVEMSTQAQYKAEFKRELTDSDAFHWGEGEVSIGADFITLKGKLAPGPDYRLYLSKEYVETELDFNRVKPTMQMLGDVKTFENFAVAVPSGVDINQFNTVIVWCETFGEFITSTQYR